MNPARALFLVVVLAAQTFACAGSTSPSPPQDTSDLTQEKPATSEAKTPPPAPVTTKPADKHVVAPAPTADATSALQACLMKCTDADCAKQCFAVTEPALPGDDGSGSGRGGDATCCVGGQLWVCHATGQNGASCDANLTPPGDNCEQMAANDGSCP